MSKPPELEKIRKKSTSQLFGELGVKVVSYELMKLGWSVYQNQGAGYDLYIRKNVVAHKVEVKSSDYFQKTGKYKQHFRFPLTSAEGERADFVVVYLRGDNRLYSDKYFQIKSLFHLFLGAMAQSYINEFLESITFLVNSESLVF